MDEIIQESIKKIREIYIDTNESEKCAALKTAISALEKQIPKKNNFNSEDDREYEDFICPNCKDILQQRRKGAKRIMIYKFNFCHNCGQKLDWE